MSDLLLSIYGRDPLLFRDGRPFSNELGALAAYSLPVPMPGTVAGFVRTLIGRQRGWDWQDEASVEKARRISVSGPILVRGGEALLPAPADAVIYREESTGRDRIMPLRPLLEPPGRCDLPGGLVPLRVSHDVKPQGDYRWWPWRHLQRWLAHPTGEDFPPPEEPVAGLPLEQRVHVAIDDTTGASRERHLFTAQFVSFEEYRWPTRERHRSPERLRWSLLVQLEGVEGGFAGGTGALGGEGRLAVAEPASSEAWPSCPAELRQALAGARRLRMVLATPAIFRDGWKPGWLDGDLTGQPPCAPGLRVKLVAAAVGRRQAVSGWDYRRREPKPLRYLAPAGSVYFFEVLAGDPVSVCRDGWLRSVCDDEQDRRDGYGLALWGIWS